LNINNLFSVLSLVSVFIYVYIGIYSYKLNPKSRVNRVFFLLCSSYGIWSFAYSFAYLAQDRQVFSLWNKIAAIGWCSFSALTMYLVLLITENQIVNKRLVKILIFLPALIFFYMAVFLFGADIETSVIVSNIFYVGNFLYNFIFLFVSIVAIFAWGLKTKSVRVKKQSKILVVCTIIPFILNLLSQDLLPLLGYSQIPLMGQLYSVIMILGTYRVISKYRLMSLPDKLFIEEIFKEIMDIVLLLNKSGKIVKISKHALNLLKFEESQLLNRDFDCVIEQHSKGEVPLNEIIGNNNSTFYGIKLLAKDGEEIPVNISCKQVFDDLHDFLGVIIVMQDLSLIHDLRRKNEELEAYIQQATAAQDEMKIQYDQNVESKRKLSVSEEKFRTMFEQAPLGIALSDSVTGEIHKINPKFAEIIGRSEDEVIDMDWQAFTHPDDIKENLKNTALINNHKIKCFNLNKRYIKPNGAVVWAKITVAALRLDNKNNTNEICMIEDITDQKLNEDALRASEYTFRRLFEGSSDAILILENHRVINCNPAAIELLGYVSKESIVGKNTWELSPENQPDGIPSIDKALNLTMDVQRMGKYKFEWWHKKENGIEFPVEIMMTSILLNGKQVLHALLRDVSEQKRLEKKLEYLSYNDVLTGLYNRRFFEEELRRLNVQRNLPLTLVMADVNGLKLINDSFGHAMGDELLKKVGEVIIKGCRSDDIVARLGGDEFIILLPRTDTMEAEQIVERIKAYASKEKVGSIAISISFGWESKNNEEEDIQEVLKKAEDYMYKKKLFEGPSMRGKTIKAIINTLHEKNKREEQHSHRVSALCNSIGKALALPDGEIEELKTVGLLHDIGKIAIEETTLNKQGSLSEAEWEEIKRHPEIGYRILSTVNDMSEMAEYVLCHHERWDGTGYPRGLKGEEIPFQSRIIAIADAYDAMTSERSYRSALQEEAAIDELQRNSGIQFDPKIVNIFIETVGLGRRNINV